jgi:hypothetical protein
MKKMVKTKTRGDILTEHLTNAILGSWDERKHTAEI